MLTAGVFVGILAQSGMLNAMVTIIVDIIPSSAGSFLHIIVAVLAMPLFMVLGADGFLFGLFPILAGVGQSFGVDPMWMAAASLIGANFCLLISPVAPTTYLAMDMLDTSLRENLKKNGLRIYALTLVVIVIAIIIGVLPL